MSFYLTIFVISDNEATRRILKLAFLPQADRALGRLLPWLCLGKSSLKCSLWEMARAFTACSNCTIFWGKHTLPLSSRPWGGTLIVVFQVLSSWILQGMKRSEVLSMATSMRYRLRRTTGILETRWATTGREGGRRGLRVLSHSVFSFSKLGSGRGFFFFLGNQP